MSRPKYMKQGSLRKYFGDDEDVLDRVHNMLKHGMDGMGKYQVYLVNPPYREPDIPLKRRGSNRHHGNIYRTG